MDIDGVQPSGKQLLLTNFQLLRILQGHPMGARTSDGESVTVRLPTTDELLEGSQDERRRLIETMKDQPGWSPPQPMTRAQAEDLTQPLTEP
jgi:hypothetical protein